ncbi:MAG: Bug family tripartite tricarboxylate transporter substrate binding protein [Pseudolabrys sp.]
MKKLLGLFCCAVLSALCTTQSQAAYPDKPIKIIVSAPAGTAPDLIARLLGPTLTEIWGGQTIIVENKAGANGNLAAGEVSRADPDGYTLLMTPAGTLTANPSLYPKSAVTNLTPITQIGSVPFTVSVRPSLGVKTLPELLALIRSKPAQINCATTANGSFPHLAAEMLKQDAKLDYQIIKHNGGAAAGTSVAGEHTDFVVETAAVLAPFIESGKLVPLATTGSERSPAAPNLPTIAEAGVPGYSMTGWIALVGPHNLPDSIANTVQKAVAEALAKPGIRQKLDAMRFTVIGNSPAQFKKVVADERAKLQKIVEQAGLRQE